MPYYDDVHNMSIVIDRIDHAIVTDADAPKVISSLKLRTPMRSGVRRESFNTRDDAARYSGLELFELPTGRPCKDNGVLSHADVAGEAPRRASSRSSVILVVRTLVA